MPKKNFVAIGWGSNTNKLGASSKTLKRVTIEVFPMR